MVIAHYECQQHGPFMHYLGITIGILRKLNYGIFRLVYFVQPSLRSFSPTGECLFQQYDDVI